MLREILNRSHFDEEKNYIARSQRCNIVEVHHPERNYKMIPFSWREKVYRTLIDDEILLKFIMVREIPNSSHFGEE